jgi:glycosyltransferase involved in cell wall biosynthesis
LDRSCLWLIAERRPSRWLKRAKNSMRIAQVAPLEESVPPRLYGGTERVIAWLTEELIGLGHEVTLFASGDSQTRATLVPVWPRAVRFGRPRLNTIIAQTALVETVARRAPDFDVIHWHTDWLHLPLCSRLKVPSVTTLHGRLDLPGLSEALRHFPHAPFISISHSQRAPLGNVNWLGTVYHGLPPDSLQACFEPGSYLAFLGRLTPEKGPETAIRLARFAGMPLRIAAKLPHSERRYFEERVLPLIESDGIQFIGEINGRNKERFLAEAAALLFPIKWPEPFGLVMIEAMACGTPVIAFRRGSVPEVIEEGVTGFIVENEKEARRAIRRLPELDRRGVRSGFEQRFSARRMAEDYVRYYRMLNGCVSGNRLRTDEVMI